MARQSEARWERGNNHNRLAPTKFKWRLNKIDPTPLYHQVKEQIYQRILAGEWAAGDPLPTEQELCEVFEVSRITISRALRDLTEEGVLYRIRGRGTFVADRNARSSVSKTIGLVIHKTELSSESYFNDIVQGIDETARELGYRILLLTFDEKTEGVDEGTFCVHNVLAKNLDGMIITAEQLNPEEFPRLQARQIPFVIVNYHIEDEKVNWITVDWEQGMEQLVTYLAEQGYEEIGYLGGCPSRYDVDKAKFAGFQRTLQARGLTYHPEWFRECPYTERDARIPGLAREILRQKPRPRALFCADDIMAAQVLQVCYQERLKVPRDLAVVGFGDLAIATRVYPEVTTVRVPRREMGRQAMSILGNMTAAVTNPDEAKEAEVVQRIITPELQKRNSA